MLPINQIITVNIPYTQHYCQASYRKFKPNIEEIKASMSLFEHEALPEEAVMDWVKCQDIASVKSEEGAYFCHACAEVIKQSKEYIPK